MYLFQFLADPAGPKPVVFEMARLSTTMSAEARTAYQPLAHVAGQWDAFGSEQSPYNAWEMTVNGMALVRGESRLREPAHRAAHRLLGQHGWLLAYRFEGCSCPTCGNDCTCGYAQVHRASVVWYGSTGRLIKVDGPSVQGDGFEYGMTPYAPQLAFVVDRPWERLSGRHWGFGDLKRTVDGNQAQLGVGAIADLIAFRHQPCRMLTPPSHGYWWRLPHAAIARYAFVEENCVANWSAGGWLAGYMQLAGDPSVPVSLYTPGDWPPDAHFAFTNFHSITISFKHNGVVHTTLSFTGPVSSPQYLYIDGTTGETSIRYCPVSLNPCMDLEAIATYVPEAAFAYPAAVSFSTGNGLSLLRPGWNEITAEGRHFPGSMFVWSYDVTTLWS